MGAAARRIAHAEREELTDDGIVRRSLSIDSRAVDKETRSVRVVASTDTIDSYGEIVEQKFDLKRYKKNPVVLWAHNACGGWLGDFDPEDILPIGFATDVAVKDGQLEATLRFVDDKANKLAEKVFQGILQGSLRAVSIGFKPGKVTEEEVDGKKVYRLSKNELYEISVVPMGANPDAVAEKAIAMKQLRRLADESAAEGNNDMDAKEFQAALEKAQAELATARAECATHATNIKSLTEQVTKLEGDLATEKTASAGHKERADKAEGELQAVEVKALVGKKITPAEQAEFLELRRSNPDLFKKMVEKRSELTITKEVIKADTKAPASGPAKDGGSGASAELADLAQSEDPL